MGPFRAPNYTVKAFNAFFAFFRMFAQSFPGHGARRFRWWFGTAAGPIGGRRQRLDQELPDVQALGMATKASSHL